MLNTKFGNQNKEEQRDDVMIVPNQSGIDHCDNVINFYSDIEDGSISQLISLIRQKNMECAKVQYQFNLPTPPPIHLHINSYGGLLLVAIGGMEIIRNNPIPIWTYVDGTAASAATILSVAGHRRFMYRESVMLIHQLRTGFWGRYDELIDEVKNSKLSMDKIKRIYETHTKLTRKDLDKLLKQDLYLTAEQCLEYGMVDEIIGA